MPFKQIGRTSFERVDSISQENDVNIRYTARLLRVSISIQCHWKLRVYAQVCGGWLHFANCVTSKKSSARTNWRSKCKIRQFPEDLSNRCIFSFVHSRQKIKNSKRLHGICYTLPLFMMLAEIDCLCVAGGCDFSDKPTQRVVRFSVHLSCICA